MYSLENQYNVGQTAVWGFPYLQAERDILCLSRRRKFGSEIRKRPIRSQKMTGLILGTSRFRFSSQKLHRCYISCKVCAAESIHRHSQWVTLQFDLSNKTGLVSTCCFLCCLFMCRKETWDVEPQFLCRMGLIKFFSPLFFTFCGAHQSNLAGQIWSGRHWLSTV